MAIVMIDTCSDSGNSGSGKGSCIIVIVIDITQCNVILLITSVSDVYDVSHQQNLAGQSNACSSCS